MLIGFNSIKSTLLNSYRQQKLHHAILLHGKKGIGKASFAKELAAEILGGNNSANLQNPDLFVIEKDSDKKEIGIDKIRAIADFINQTSAISPNKIIVINSVCELNKASSNALLKVLEEPRPNNFLILVCHNLNRVLPTILSRCFLVKVPDLSAQDFTQILTQNNLGLTDKDTNFLGEIFDYAAADAINIGADTIRFYELFLRSISNKKISDELLKKVADKNFVFTILEKCIEFFFSRLNKCHAGLEIDFFFEEEKVFLNLIRNFSPEKVFTIQDESLKQLRKTTSLNLDRKLCFINIFNQICYEK